MDWKDWIHIAILIATIVAIVYGPIKAVEISRRSDEAREKKRRQYNILHSLMRTRAFSLHADHVMALNLVQLEFYGQQKIDDAFRRYMEHLGQRAPTDGTAFHNWSEDRTDRFYSMVQAIAEVLGFKYDKADLQRLSYSPQRWADDEGQERAFRALFIDVLEGRRPFPVTQFRISEINKKFPPPP
ncbi:MAG: hypothetical protein K9G48_08720 [Reyranella sp.]|nr:hypothetical protein [Reyranella sp.]